jgi:L-lactate dehydrogenase complex protein LldG
VSAPTRRWPAWVARRLADEGVRRLLLDRDRPEGAALARALPAGIDTVTFDRPLEAWKPNCSTPSTPASPWRAPAGRHRHAGAGARCRIAAHGVAGAAHAYRAGLRIDAAPDLHAAVRAERWSDGMPTNLVMVSGPSKTSDIQQTLAYGAHGPRRLWVVIVTDGETAR